MPAKVIVGIDVGSTHLRAVEASWEKGALTIRKVGSLPLLAGTVEYGEVKDAPELTRALKELWRRYKFASKNVRVAINSDNDINQLMTLNWEKDFAQTFRFNLGEDVFANVDEYYVGYHTIKEYFVKEEDRTVPQGGFKNVRKKDILLSGAKKVSVDTLLQSLKNADLRAISIDLAPLSLLRAEATSNPDAVNVHINIGAAMTMVIIEQNNQPLFLRTIPRLGGAQITQTVSRELELPLEEAERLKISIVDMAAPSLPLPAAITEDSVFAADEPTETAAPETSYSPQQNDAWTLVNAELSAIVDNIRQSIDYFSFSRDDVEINDISLSGGTAAFNAIRLRLAREVGTGGAYISTPFTTLAEAGTIKYTQGTVDKEYEYAIALGAALGKGAKDHG